MLQNIKAIEYNVWMSLLDYLTLRVTSVGGNYITGRTIKILPSYPKDALTAPNKPAIIVQKVTSKHKKLGFGNFIGKFFDVDTNTMYDVNGTKYEAYFDIHINANGNIECQLLTDMIVDEITNISHIDIKDFTATVPTVVGSLAIDREIDVTYLSPGDTENYASMVMVKVTSIRHIVPQQEFVDLSKLIKWNQTIKL